MFSISAAGLTKALTAVTISLHPAAAHHTPASYTVRPGDTMSDIARHEYGKAADWPALWWINRHRVPNPEAIRAGQRLRLSTWHPRRAWLEQAALAASGASSPAAPAAAPTAATVVAPAPSAGSYSGAAGSYAACVIARESGGNASAVNPYSGAGGLYGFMPGTWQSLGYSGLPENAPVSEQNAAFQREYARSGSAPWASDGC